MGKKPNVKNLNKQNKRGMISSIAFALLALVLTVVVFAGLVYAENALTDNIVYKEVVVAKSDIRALAYPVLRHRVKLSFNAVTEGKDIDTVLTMLLDELDGVKKAAPNAEDKNKKSHFIKR